MNILPSSRFRIVALLAGFVVLGSAASPAAARWVPLGPPDGATVLSLAFDPVSPSVVYAGTWRGGVAKSLDGGRTWSPSSFGLGNPSVTALAVDPRRPGWVYAGTDGGLYRSRNGGRSWLPSELKLPVEAIAVDPRSDILNAATRNGLFHSSDGGVRWVATHTGLAPRDRRFFAPALVAAPSRPRTLYAAYVGAQSGVFRSDDTGRTWRKVLNARIQALAVDPADPDRVYATDDHRIWTTSDGGTTWTRLWLGRGTARLVIDPADPARIFGLGAFQGVFVSEDEGRTWRPVAGLDRRVWDLAADPGDPRSLLAATAGGGVLRSDDDGRSWQSSTAGLVNFEALVVRVVPERGALFTTGGSGIYRTTDGGASWEWVLRNVPVTALAVDPADPDTLYAGNGDPEAIGRLVYKSEDGGDTWRPSSPGITTGPILDLIVLPDEPETVYAATWESWRGEEPRRPGLFRSTDGGGSWSQVPGILGVQDLELDPARPGVIHATQSRGILSSEDGGRTWRVSTVGGPPWARKTRQITVSPVDGDDLAVIDPYSVFLSPDAGRSWRRSRVFGPDLVRSVVFDRRDAGTLYLGLAEGVQRSTDGGRTWHRFAQGLPGVAVNDLHFDPADPSKLYAATSSAGVFVRDLNR